MILRDRCSTSYDLVAGAVLYTGAVEKSQNAWYKAPSAALNFPFLKEVSQNCFVFDVVSSNIEEVLQNCCGFGRC